MSRANYPQNELIVILGPTASGKSTSAIKLAKKFNGEIVSADSRQIYQEMDIGTAKPFPHVGHSVSHICQGETSHLLIDGIPHYMIDIIKPNQEFTLAQYKKLAVKIIEDIQKRNKLPFLVGGTGLYIQAIVDNLKIPQVKPNKKLRSKLEKLTNQELFKQVQKLDRVTGLTIDVHNKRRLIRALEVCLLTKKPFSQQRKKGLSLFDVLQIGLKLDKKALEQKINQRTEQMFQSGLVKEVKRLFKKYPSDLPSMTGIGYQEIIQYLQKKINLQQAKQLIKLHTKQYAQRQMTWFKRDPAPAFVPSSGRGEQARRGASKRIHWLKNYQAAEKLINDFLNR